MLSWFPRPVVWLPVTEAKHEVKTVDITEDMPLAYIYALGGKDGQPATCVERLDPLKNTWSAVAPMSTKRYLHGSAVIGGCVYAVGGHGGVECLSSVERFDPTQNKWTAVAPMSTKRAALGVGVVGGQLYAVGGYDGSALLSSVERFDPAQNTWCTVASMSTTRSRLGVAAMDGQLYAVGGWDGDEVSLSVTTQHKTSGVQSPQCRRHGAILVWL